VNPQPQKPQNYRTALIRFAALGFKVQETNKNYQRRSRISQQCHSTVVGNNNQPGEIFSGMYLVCS